MTFTNDDKRDLAIIGGISAILVFIYLFTPAQAASPSNLPATELQNPQGETVDNITVPDLGQLNLPPFPSVPVNQSSASITPNQQMCGCGCDDTKNTYLYSNEQQLADQYAQQESQLYSKYISQVNDALPSFIKQYVNSADGYISSISNSPIKGSF